MFFFASPRVQLRQLLKVLAHRTPSVVRRVLKPLTPSPVRRFVYSDVDALAALLWAGFAKVGSSKLEAIEGAQRPAHQIAIAAWGLARFYASKGDYERALSQLGVRQSVAPKVWNDITHIVVYVEVLLRAGRAEEAKEIAQSAIARLGEVSELCHCAANTTVANRSLSRGAIDQLRLSWLSKPFVSAGLAPLETKDASKPLAFDNLTATAPNESSSQVSKISVLMPAFNAAETIGTAIDSVLRQTWRNLELIIVDDGSDDGTWTIVQSFVTRDSRIIALRHRENRGPYAARNKALRQATGDFITVHDADDWSHPQKLALQAYKLRRAGGVVNATKQIRVHPCLRVHVMPDGALILDCFPSLMMRRAVIEGLGGWDECRMGADDELWKRVLLRYGRRCSAVICKNTPMSFHLFRGDSLTSNAAIGSATLRYGARRQYGEAYRYWHRLEMAKTVPNLRIRSELRPFPIPNICKQATKITLRYDILLVSDFSIPDATNSSLLTAARRFGFTSACFHWPHLESVGRDVDITVRHLLHEEIADCVVGGETVTCNSVIVTHPTILIHTPDLLPKVQTRNCSLMLNQRPGMPEAKFDLDFINAQVQAIFGVLPIWTKAISAGDVLRELAGK